MILTYRYRLKMNGKKGTVLAAHAFAVNQVWNYCNSVQRDIEARYRAGAAKRKWPSHFDLAALTKGTSKELGIHGQTIQCVCHRFSVARDQRRRSLRFRSSSGAKRSLGWVPFQAQSRRIDDNSITYLGKTFLWFGSERRPLPATVKGGAFVEDASGKWWVIFDAEVDARATGPGSVGIDLGLKTLATCSDGHTVPALRHYRTYQEKLATAQRAKNKRRVKAIHAKIANSRRDHLHKESCRIARDNGFIAVGNVSSSRLAKTKMAKSIHDASWAIFREQLRYKASRHGAVFVDVDERFTTQRCSCCGVIPDSSPKGMGALGMRSWDCSNCGESHDRDVNAARNILRVALSAQRPVGESQPSGWISAPLGSGLNRSAS